MLGLCHKLWYSGFHTEWVPLSLLASSGGRLSLFVYSRCILLTFITVSTLIAFVSLQTSVNMGWFHLGKYIYSYR